MNRFLFNLSILIILVFTGCSKDSSDYIGKYSYYNADDIRLPDKDRTLDFIASWGRSNKKYKKPRTEEKRINLLEKIDINIYNTDSEGTITGEMEFKNYYLSSGRLKSWDVDFSMSNIRTINDTLYFTLSQEGYSEKNIKGFLYNTDQESFLGLEHNALGNAKSNEFNPWFISQNERWDVFTNKSSITNIEDYYNQQIDSLSNRLNDSSLSRDEIYILENSIEYLKDNFVDDDN